MIQSLPMNIAGIGRYLPERIVTTPRSNRMIGLEPGMIEKTAAGSGNAVGGLADLRLVDGRASSLVAWGCRSNLDDIDYSQRLRHFRANIPDGGP
jgi:3-oxoacyl-[acyl-carrier-protein] synthase III